MSIFKNQRWFFAALLAIVSGILAPGSPAQARPKKAVPTHHKTLPKTSPKSSALPPLAPAVPVPDAAAAPAAQIGDVLVYDGLSPQDGKISLMPWGGGMVSDDSDVSFSKGHSLKVTTLDPYQGAKIVFQTPADLGALTDSSRVMVFTLRLTADTRVFPQTAPPTQQTPDTGQGQDVPVTENMRPAYGNARLILAQIPSEPPPSPQDNVPPPSPQDNVPPPDNGTPVQPAQAPSAQSLTKVHLIFTLASGAQADVLRPFPDLRRSDAGAGVEQWVMVGVPLTALHFTGGSASSPLQSITIAGDDYAVFYVGQIKVTTDTTPLTCFASVDEANVPRDTPVTLHGTASGGFSALQYSWDFDASDGITDQAAGPVVTTQYSQGPQDYTATLTVSDIDGIKKPVTSTVVLHVQ